MLNLFFLIFFNFNLFNSQPKLRVFNLSPEKYQKMMDQEEYSLVVFYENWCKHSKEAIQIFKNLSKNVRFLEMEISLGFFNLQKFEEFRKMKDIKNIPLIHLIINKTEITYKGNLEENQLLSWVLEKTKLSKIPKIKDQEQIEKLKKNSKIFLYYGEIENPRYQIFAEGFYHYPQFQFFWTDDPYVQQAYDLKDNNIYYFEKEKTHLYRRAFKKSRYLEWVILQVRPKFTKVNENSLKNLKIAKNPTLVFIHDDQKTSQESLQYFQDNYELYYEKYIGKTCNINNSHCKNFLEIYKDEITEFPVLLLIVFDKKIKPPLIYEQQNASLENIQKFLKNVQNKQQKLKIFSEVVPHQDKYYNNSVRKISRNLLPYFFVDNESRDAVVLFYSSQCKKCVDMKQKFEELGSLIYENQQNKDKIALAHLDMNKNSYEVLNVPNEVIFLRMYKHGKVKKPIDKEIDPNDSESFQKIFLNFLTDISTERIEFFDFDGDM